ncbi:MAG TPA: PEGA domain-containing protein, partial [Polyangia bacterium]
VSVDLPPPRPVPAAGPSASALGALAPAPPLAPAGVVAPPALLAAHDSASGMAPLPVVPLARVEAAAAAPPVVSRPFVINLDDSADAGQELRRPESQGFESAGPGFPGAFDPAPALAPPPAPPPLARSPRAAGRLLVGVIGGAAVLILVAAVLLLVLWRQPASGAVEVASVPSGAPVQFDDQPAAKPTPVTVRDVDRRVPHRVRVVQPGYEPWEGRVVFERSQQSLQLIAVLTPIVGVVSIETEPAGAQVALDDRPQGATPRRIEGLPVQSPVRLRVQLPGYRTVERTVEWAGQKTIEVKLKLEREGEATPKRGGKAGRGR